MGWFKLGRLQLTQGGKDAEFRIVAGVGYTAIPAQLGECLIHFRTSNGDGQVNGFYGAGIFTLTGKSKIINAIKVVQITTSSWGFYASLDIYSGDGATLTLNSKDGVWTSGFLLLDPPSTGGFFLDLINEQSFRSNSYFSENVGIGTTDTKGYKLAVAGSMVAESIKVKLQGVWPDYVFTKTYKLPTLPETEKYIQEKGHLPGIPSSEEVKNYGIDLGEINAQLLHKIEELTLHLIEHDKKEKVQQLNLEMQTDAIKRLTSRLESLERKSAQ